MMMMMRLVSFSMIVEMSVSLSLLRIYCNNCCDVAFDDICHFEQHDMVVVVVV